MGKFLVIVSVVSLTDKGLLYDASGDTSGFQQVSISVKVDGGVVMKCFLPIG
jgi:hypothetical protein